MERSSPASLAREHLEEDSHWWFASRTRALFAILDRILPHRNLRILDVGCGAGNMIRHLSRYGQVVGIDNNPKPLKVARERGYDARVASAEAIPFPQASFDLVTALDVIEHCEDDMLILRECQRVLVPGGWLVATLPAFGWLWSANDEANKHKRRYTKKDWHLKLLQAGLVPLRTTYSYFLIFPLAAARIMLQKGKQRKLSAPDTNAKAYQVEMEPTSPFLNSILSAVGTVEAQLLHWVSLPVGTSIISVAQKELHG